MAESEETSIISWDNTEIAADESRSIVNITVTTLCNTIL
jgi:hypothetical protein